MMVLNGPEMVSGDSDLVTHIAYGEAILHERALPASDPLLWSPPEGAPVMVIEWGFGLLMAALHQLLGLTGPLLLGALLGSLVIVGVYQSSRAGRANFWPALIFTLAALLACRVHLTTRPHLISWLFVLLWWRLITRERASPWPTLSDTAKVVVLGVIWANVHGGFPLAIGLGLLRGLGLLADRWSGRGDGSSAGSVLALTVLLALSTLLNPYGTGLHLHILAFLSDPYVIGGTSDFGRPSIEGGSLFVYLSLSALVLAPLAARWRRVSLADLVPVLALIAAAGLTLRQIPFLGIVGAIVASHAAHALILGIDKPWARAVQASNERLDRMDSPPLGLRSLSATAGLTALSLLLAPVLARLDPTVAPIPSLRFIEEQTELHPERGFQDFLLGGFVLHATSVQRVYMHALNANYPRSVLEGYVLVDQAEEGWHDFLVAQHVTWTLVIKERPIHRALDDHPCWESSHQDEVAAIHIRSEDCR